MRPATSCLIAICLGVSAIAAGAEPLAVGERIEAVALEDQHGEKRRIGAGVDLVLLSRDMDAGDLLKEALADATERTLAELGAVYVADISGMPGFVSTLFAIPSMRERPYPMLLDRDGRATEDLPSAEGRATLIRLDALEIESVRHFASASGLRKALGLEAEESSPE